MNLEKTLIRDFTKGNISKQLITFAWPLFLSNLLQMVYNMVDMIVVGNVLGKSGISAVSVGGDVLNFLTFVAMGFSAAGQVIIAKYIGSKRNAEIGRFIGTMSSFLILCSLIIGAIGLVFQKAILSVMNTPAEAFEGAVGYSAICMAGLVFIYGYNIVSAILRGMGDSKHPFIFVSIAAITNLILDIVFVVFLNTGAGGAALATVISQGLSFLLSVAFIIKSGEKTGIELKASYFIKWNKSMLSDLLKLGTPMAIKMASIQFSKMFVNSWINSYGVAVSAFAGIANKISSISNLVSNAMNTSGSTMVGQNIAAGEYKRVKGILKNLAVISLSISAVMSAVICIFPDFVFGIFTSDKSVLDIAGGFIPIAVLLFLASALRGTMNALLNGSGNYKINFATAIFDGIIMRIGLAVLFGLVLDMKYYGFWLGDALAGYTPFIIGVVFYFSGRWKSDVVNQTNKL